MEKEAERVSPHLFSPYNTILELCKRQEIRLSRTSRVINNFCTKFEFSSCHFARVMDDEGYKLSALLRSLRFVLFKLL